MEINGLLAAPCRPSFRSLGVVAFNCLLLRPSPHANLTLFTCYKLRFLRALQEFQLRASLFSYSYTAFRAMTDASSIAFNRLRTPYAKPTGGVPSGGIAQFRSPIGILKSSPK